MKLRIGIVGLGNVWETRHRPALRALSDRLDVRAVCDPVGHRAVLAAHEFGAASVDGVRALAAREDVDALVLLSTEWYGPLPIFAACEAEKAIYCAATLNLDPQAALQVKSRVEQAGIAFVAEMPCRQAPATLRLKELIATHLGEPRLLFCHRRQPVPDLAGQQDSTSMRHLIEVVDWCRYVIGREPSSVVGVAHQDATGASDDYEMMSLDFSEDKPGSGAVAQISCGQYIPPAWHEAIGFRIPAALQVACERGIAFVDLPATVIWFDAAGRHMESLEHERPVGEQLLLNFYRSATSLIRNTSSLEDAYRALHVVLSARESHRQGRRIDLTAS